MKNIGGIWSIEIPVVSYDNSRHFVEEEKEEKMGDGWGRLCGGNFWSTWEHDHFPKNVALSADSIFEIQNGDLKIKEGDLCLFDYDRTTKLATITKYD